MSPSEFWHETVFQNTLQVSLQLARSPAPEEQPFTHKYEAISLLKALLQTPSPFHFITLTYLGEFYNDVEQLSDSNRCYQQALAKYSKLLPEQAPLFYHYLIVIYNSLGLTFINREQNQLGMGCLGKACQVYSAFREYPGQDVYHNRSFEPYDRPFHYLYEGGIDHQQMQDSYTLTLFYLAQGYTKLGLKDKAAEFCGLTLQRQHQSKKYDLKDFVNNLIGLSQYYQGNKYYSQAQYLLMLALKVLPEGKKRKLRASVQISLGTLLGELLQFGCKRIENGDLQEEDNKLVGQQMIIFNQFEQAFPKITLPNDIQGCKSLFRQANTQLKKAHEVFVLDGYVTEHIDILFLQSRLYRSLAYLQKSGQRRASMLEKRKEMLEPLLKQLNPKAYPATWQKILVEVAEIINDLFTLRVALLGAKGFPSQERFSITRELGKKSIGYYKQITNALFQDKEATKDEQYYRSFINSKINIAKATSKLMSSDRKQRVQFLKQSWKLYQQIINYIQTELPQNLRNCFSKEVQLTKDMIAMMPNKIDRINYGPATLLLE